MPHPLQPGLNPFTQINTLVRANLGHPLLYRCKEWWLATPGSDYGLRMRNLIRPQNYLQAAGVPQPGTITSGWRGETHPGGLGSVTTDGSNDVWLGALPTAQLDSVTQFTLMAWMKRFATNGIAMLQYNGGVLNPSIEIEIYSDGNGYITVATVARTFGTVTTVGDAQRWTHYALVYNGGGATNADRLKFYINGLERSMGFTGTIPATTGSINTGVSFGKEGYPAGVFVRSSYDDIRVYDYAMRASEVLTQYRATLAGYPDMLPRMESGYLNFYHLSGTGAPRRMLMGVGI